MFPPDVAPAIYTVVGTLVALVAYDALYPSNERSPSVADPLALSSDHADSLAKGLALRDAAAAAAVTKTKTAAALAAALAADQHAAAELAAANQATTVWLQAHQEAERSRWFAAAQPAPPIGAAPAVAPASV